MPTRMALEPLLNVGGQMANLCYNLSQRGELNSRDRRVMGELYRAWDDETEKLVTLTKQPRKPTKTRKR